MCGSMVDIQCATADGLRLGHEKTRKKKLQGKNIMSASATQGDHNKIGFSSLFLKLMMSKTVREIGISG